MSVGVVPAGSVDDVQVLADRVQAVGAESAEAARRLSRLRAGGWVGVAAVAFEDAAASVPPQLDRAAESFAGAAWALRSYALELGQAQDAARRAAVLWADADLASRTWRQQLDRLDDDERTRLEKAGDPGAAGRASAQRLYDEALAELELVAQRTTRRLVEAAAVAPNAPGLLSRAWGAVTSFGGGVVDGAKGIAAFAWRFNPIRAAIDPDGFERDVQQLASGLWYAVRNPDEVAKAFLEAWREDPAHALGELLPSLIAGPGTARLAAKVAEHGADLAKKAGTAVAQRVRTIDWGDDRGSVSLELLTLGVVRQRDVASLDVEHVVRDIEAMTGMSFERLPGQVYRSTRSGLIYAPSFPKSHNHRILHVLAHALPDPEKSAIKKHSVFLGGVALFDTIDDAWFECWLRDGSRWSTSPICTNRSARRARGECKSSRFRTATRSGRHIRHDGDLVPCVRRRRRRAVPHRADGRRRAGVYRVRIHVGARRAGQCRFAQRPQ